MNKARRDELTKAATMLQEAQAIIESCRDEEQEYYDNMPESLQGGDKGSNAESAIESMESAISGIEEAANSIEEAQA